MKNLARAYSNIFTKVHTTNGSTAEYHAKLKAKRRLKALNATNRKLNKAIAW